MIPATTESQSPNGLAQNTLTVLFPQSGCYVYPSASQRHQLREIEHEGSRGIPRSAI